MEKKLAIFPEDYNTPAYWQRIKEMAKEFHSAGALPAHWNSAPRILMGIQAGTEMGLQPMEALTTLLIVNGKVSMEGIAMLKKIRQAGVRVKWDESTNEKCTVTLTRPEDDTDTHTETFTIEDAQQAGLVHKDNWKKYPKDMLRWKALSRAARFHCPDIAQGAYITEVDAEEISGGRAKWKDGAVEVEVVNPVVDEIINDIQECKSRKDYMQDILPRIKEVRGLGYADRAKITKAAEVRLEEFAKEESEAKKRKAEKATREAVEQASQDDTEVIDAEIVEDRIEDPVDETSDNELEVVIKKIRSCKKQTELINYIQGEVLPMPLSKKQMKEVEQWVSNKVTQLNGKVPDEQDMKMIFSR